MIKRAPKKGKGKKEIRKTSEFWFWLIYSLPLTLIVILFPYKDNIFLNNPYPFNASFSGTTIIWNMGFTQIPEIIPTYIPPPILSAIGIPKDVFAYQKCFYHNSYFKINGKNINNNIVSFDIRVKVDSDTYHLKPNNRLCLPHEDDRKIAIYVGNSKGDTDKVAELLKNYNKQSLDGETVFIMKQQPVYNKIFMFLVSLFSFYGLWWAVIIAWKSVHEFIYIKIN